MLVVCMHVCAHACGGPGLMSVFSVTLCHRMEAESVSELTAYPLAGQARQRVPGSLVSDSIAIGLQACMRTAGCYPCLGSNLT